ncbi:unnamed protein product [Nesidiocoris tenuis]|uniref:Dynein heavy chain coiled coil stalk domain-containing protein n=1 Tax=Nesidiocoris tenuis TaxID=355587 RepID=A0A6H5H950_9HEMI|nr:unnamed protein product [Nesidiocoris tenuis]
MSLEGEETGQEVCLWQRAALESRPEAMWATAPGVGKSAIAKEVLNELARSELWIPNALTFSAQTSSTKTQEMIEGKLEKKKRAVLGAPMGKRVVVFIDDVNMPRPEVYGAQPPIELLSGPPFIFHVQTPAESEKRLNFEEKSSSEEDRVSSGSSVMEALPGAILQGFLDSFIASIQSLCDGLVLAAITIYKRLAQDLLPIPAKSHYVFNLRDLSKCVQGILQASTDSIRSPHDMLRLFFHENLRVYHDRLVDTDDKSYFYRLLSSTCANVFHDPVLELPAKGPITLPPLLFGDFLNQQPVGSRIYQEISNVQKLKNVLEKLFETNELVSVMQKQIVTMEPELREKSKATEQLMVSVAKEKTAADEVKQVVLVDEAAAKKIAAECQLLADDAQKELDQAMPAMEAAVKALEALNKNDINEIRVFNKPPHLVKYTLEAVCLLLGAKQDWASAKVVLGDGNFLKKLQDYDKNHISDVLLKKMKAFIDNPDFVPEVVATQSKACKSLCMWVRAIDSYAKVYRVVEPKRKKSTPPE